MTSQRFSLSSGGFSDRIYLDVNDYWFAFLEDGRLVRYRPGPDFYRETGFIKPATRSSEGVPISRRPRRILFNAQWSRGGNSPGSVAVHTADPDFAGGYLKWNPVEPSGRSALLALYTQNGGLIANILEANPHGICLWHIWQGSASQFLDLDDAGYITVV